MRENRNHYETHNTYGGYVYDYDFNCQTDMTTIASRIMSDWRFDKSCIKNAKNKNNRKEWM